MTSRRPLFFLFALLGLFRDPPAVWGDLGECCVGRESPHLRCLFLTHMPEVTECRCLPHTANNSVEDSIANVTKIVFHELTVGNVSSCVASILDSIRAELTLKTLEIAGSPRQGQASEAANVNSVKFSHLSIETLGLRQLGLSAVDASLFDGIASLSELRLSHNEIVDLEGFRNSSALLGLDTLDLSHNRIRSVSASDFASLVNLMMLNLSSNQIERIAPKSFAALSFLDQLDLSGNLLTRADATTFGGPLSVLETLLLSDNRIQTVDFAVERKCPPVGVKGACQDSSLLPELDLLDLSHNLIDNVTGPGMFSALDKLTVARLSHNHIEVLSLDAFGSLCWLATMDASNNRIQSLESDSKSPCHLTDSRNYELLANFSNNRIETLPPSVLSALGGITYLDLSNNVIYQVDKHAFAGLVELRNLKLRNNSLAKFDPAGLSGLELIDLSENQFTRVDPDWLTSIGKDRTGSLKLGGNQLECNQHLAGLFRVATCNERRGYSLYSGGALDQLRDLAERLTDGRPTVLPDPADCTLNALGSEICGNSTATDKYGTGTVVCMLQSYLALLKSGPTSTADCTSLLKEIFGQIEALYYFAKNSPTDTSSGELREVKAYILKAINKAITNACMPTANLHAFVSSDIEVGVSQFDTDMNVGTRTVYRASARRLSPAGLTFPTKLVSVASNNDDVKDNGDTTVISCNGSSPDEQQREISIQLPRGVYQPTVGNSQRVTFAVYRNQFLFPSKQEVLSGIVAANVVGKKVTNSKIVVTATVNVTDAKRKYLRCSFWEPATSSWSGEGCQLANGTDGITSMPSGSSQVTCHCDHLTNFAILLDYDLSGEVPAYHESTDRISIIGMIASIIGLALTIAYRLSVKELRRGVPQLTLLHLCVCLLLVDVLLLTAYDKNVINNEGGCFAVSLLLHFFLLAVWGWNVAEAASMYLLLVRVYNVDMRHFLPKAAAICYGFATALVVSSLVFSAASPPKGLTSYVDSYTRSGVCVVGNENSLYFVILPIAICFFINCVAFVFILRGLSQTSKSAAAAKDMRKNKSRLRQAVCVTALLGITWAIGIAKVAVQSSLQGHGSKEEVVRVFDIVFDLVNSIQGFVIFLMFCVTRIWTESRCWQSTWEHLLSDSMFSTPRWVSGSDIDYSSRKSTKESQI